MKGATRREGSRPVRRCGRAAMGLWHFKKIYYSGSHPFMEGFPCPSATARCLRSSCSASSRRACCPPRSRIWWTTSPRPSSGKMASPRPRCSRPPAASITPSTTESTSHPVGEPEALGNAAVFLGYVDGHGYELWRSDGTDAGTTLLADGIQGVLEDLLVVAAGKVYFVIDQGATLWVSDGTAAGTHALDNPWGSSRVEGCSSDAQLLGSFAGRLLFTSGFSLWTTNPAGPGLFRIRQLGHCSPDPVTFQGRLFFFAEDLGGREHLWSSNGTPVGTARLQDPPGRSGTRRLSPPLPQIPPARAPPGRPSSA